MKERLKQIRESLKKTQKEMSALLGLGEVTWQNYERGVTTPKSDILKKLDDMGYNMSWIMLGVGNMKNDTVEEEPEYANYSSGMIGSFNVNIEKVFLAMLEEMQVIYAKQLSKLPKNFIDIMAFRRTIEICRMADDPTSAFTIMQKVIKSEIEISRTVPPNERFKELMD